MGNSKGIVKRFMMIQSTQRSIFFKIWVQRLGKGVLYQKWYSTNRVGPIIGRNVGEYNNYTKNRNGGYHEIIIS